MQDLTEIVGTIVSRHADLPHGIDIGHRLEDLGIDRLDLYMIFLDLEDALHVAIDGREAEIATGLDLVHLAEQAVERQAEAVSRRRDMPRVKRTWLDTGAEQHG